MKIEFILSKDECDKILAANGYVTEEVSVKFNLYDNVYSHGSIKDYGDNLAIFTETVAYRVGDRPERFNEQPLEKLEDSFKYNVVIENLAKRKFVEMMCT